MIASGLRRWAPVFLVAFTLAAPAAAEPARLERVVLLPSPDRSSIVFELSAEPRHVTSRRISDSVLEVEAGPDIENVAPRLLKPPANVRFVDSVTVRVVQTSAGPVVKARITLSALAQAVVRSAGRRVYVDVSGVPSPVPTPPVAPAVHQRVSTLPAASPAVPVVPADAYRAAVRPSLQKLREMGPFMTSAAASADPKVTGAILPALLSARTSLAALDPPDPARGSHTMVISAVDRILGALAPEFTGDRAAAVRQSMTTIEVVGAVLTGD